MMPAPKLLMAFIFFSDNGGLNWMAPLCRMASGTVTSTCGEQLTQHLKPPALLRAHTNQHLNIPLCSTSGCKTANIPLYVPRVGWYVSSHRLFITQERLAEQKWQSHRSAHKNVLDG